MSFCSFVSRVTAATAGMFSNIFCSQVTGPTVPRAAVTLVDSISSTEAFLVESEMSVVT